jgi:hypothetical protein
MRRLGVGICLLVVAAYAASAARLYRLSYTRGPTERGIELVRGQFSIFWQGTVPLGPAASAKRGPVPGWKYESAALADNRWVEALGWGMPAYGFGKNYFRAVRAPLWGAALLGAGLAAFGWSGVWPRSKAKGCPSCNYDLSGLPPGSPCPECAAVPAPPVGS